jgi:hypothetical protein
MNTTEFEPFFKYLRGLVVTKLNEVKNTNNPDEVMKLYKHQDQIEALSDLLERYIEHNNERDIDHHKLKIRHKKALNEIRISQSKYDSAVKRISELIK